MSREWWHDLLNEPMTENLWSFPIMLVILAALVAVLSWPNRISRPGRAAHVVSASAALLIIVAVIGVSKWV